jgi:hypothetical protein
MTDQEVLCWSMEPKPESVKGLALRYSGNQDGTDAEHYTSPNGWWIADAEDGILKPREITLNECREIQAPLTDQQWRHYCVLMFHTCCREARTTNLIEDELTKNRRPLLHADATTRITALAAVLRPIVEAQHGA